MYRIFTLHRPMGGKLDETVFIKEGIAWWALLFGPLWFLYHRLWLLTAAYFALLIALAGAMTMFGLHEIAQSVIELIVAAAIAAAANDLRRWHLERRGYEFVDLMGAPNLALAEEIYFRRRGAELAPSEAPTGPPAIRHPGRRRHALTPFASGSMGPS